VFIRDFRWRKWNFWRCVKSLMIDLTVYFLTTPRVYRCAPYAFPLPHQNKIPPRVSNKNIRSINNRMCWLTRSTAPSPIPAPTIVLQRFNEWTPEWKKKYILKTFSKFSSNPAVQWAAYIITYYYYYYCGALHHACCSLYLRSINDLVRFPFICIAISPLLLFTGHKWLMGTDCI